MCWGGFKDEDALGHIADGTCICICTRVGRTADCSRLIASHLAWKQRLKMPASSGALTAGPSAVVTLQRCCSGVLPCGSCAPSPAALGPLCPLLHTCALNVIIIREVLQSFHFIRAEEAVGSK